MSTANTSDSPRKKAALSTVTYFAITMTSRYISLWHVHYVPHAAEAAAADQPD